MEQDWICKKHGDIGKAILSISCTVPFLKEHYFCALCLAELLKQKIGLVKPKPEQKEKK